MMGMIMSRTLEASDLVRLVKHCMVEPDFFCNEILQAPNDPWQSELMNAIADLDRARLGMPTKFNHDLRQRFSVSACQGPGKTHTAAKLIHWYNFTRVGRIPVTAPKQRQVVTRVWPEVRKLAAGAKPGYSSLLRIEQTKIVWLDNLEHCALVESASQPENLQGLHDRYLFFLVEEASGVSENMFPVIEGALTTPDAIMLMIGNPTRNEGEFYRSRTDPETMRLYYAMRISYRDSPRISRKWVEDMRRKHGEESPVFKVRCLGEDAGQDENQLVSLAWIDNAKDSDPEEWEDGTFPELRICVDVSDGGIDETVISVVERRQCGEALLAVTRHSWEPSVAVIEAADAADAVADHWAQTFGEHLASIVYVVDAIGVGAGTAGTLIRRGRQVIQYRGGSTDGVDTKKYRNRRTQSYLSWRDALREGTFYIARGAFGSDEDWLEFQRQAITIRARPGVERVEELETKDSMKKRGIKSPDIPDSIVMAYADRAPELDHGDVPIEVFGGDESLQGMSQWDS